MASVAANLSNVGKNTPGGKITGKKFTPKSSQKHLGPKTPANGSPNLKQTPKSANKGPKSLAPVKTPKTPNQAALKQTPKSAKNAQNQAAKQGKRKSEMVQESPKKKQKIERSPEVDARTIFLTNFPTISIQEQINKHFAKCGKVERVFRQRKFLNKQPDIFHGYVRFSSREEAVKAAKNDKSVVKGHHLRVHLSQDSIKDEDKATSIFATNLSWTAEDDDLWKAFESCGKVASVRILRNKKDGKSLGCCYVTFQSLDSVAKALKSDAQVNGRQLKIRPYSDKPKEQTQKKGQQAVGVVTESADSRDEAEQAEEEESEDEDDDEEQSGRDAAAPIKHFKGTKSLKNKKSFK